MRPLFVAAAVAFWAVVVVAAGCANAPRVDDAAAGGGKRVLFVVGMEDEARVAAGDDDALVVVSGARPAHLRALLARVDASQVRAVVSFGVAGALLPTLEPGEIVVADAVYAAADDDGDGGLRRWAVDPAWTRALFATAKRAGTHAHRVGFFGVDVMTSTPADRARMRAVSGAGAVDMESHVAAQWAEAHGLPFASLRTISDGVDFVLPDAMTASIAEDGAVDGAVVAASVLRDPAQIGALLVAGRGYGKALRALARCRASLVMP